MTGDRSVLDALANVAVIAAAGSGVEEKVPEILKATESVVRVEGWIVWGVDPFTGLRTRLYATGYPEPLMAYLDGPGFELDVVAPFSHARGGWPARVRDLPFEASQLRCMSDHYLPVGFVEGCVAPLSSVGGRCTGFLDCVVSNRRHPSDNARELLTTMARVLGRLVDPVEESRRASAVLCAEQVVIEVAPHRRGTVGKPNARVVRALGAGREDDILDRFAAVLDLLAGSAAGWWTTQFLWESPNSAWYRCRCLRRDNLSVMLGISPLPGPPYGLTRRELEVLDFVANGARNEEIARRLVVTLRTVKAHVEHIFAKLDLSTRSTATMKAIEEGLLLRPPQGTVARSPTVTRPVPSLINAGPLDVRGRLGVELSSLGAGNRPTPSRLKS